MGHRLLGAALLAVALDATASAAPENPAIDMQGFLGAAAAAAEHRAWHRITEQEFLQLRGEAGTIVLDVRTPAEYANGHLPQAQNIDIEGPDFAARIAALDKNATYAVYCHSGNRSGVALQQMAGVGFTHLYDLAGGIGAWQSMGGPMVMGGS